MASLVVAAPRVIRQVSGRCVRALGMNCPRVLAGLDAVTVDDVSRVAQELIANDRFRLAVIGPFADPARFERLLDA